VDRSIELDELVEQWTLLDEEQGLVFGKGGAGKLGFVRQQAGWQPSRNAGARLVRWRRMRICRQS
jgi:hypothetical protein